MGDERIDGGQARGVQSRSRTGSGSISPIMSPCGFLTRRSTRRFMCKAGVRSNASWWLVYKTGRALRVPRARTRGRGKKFVSPEIMISQRPAEADDRAVPGHWKGDLILGLQSSAIGTLVERTTRFTMLLHLPRMPGHGQQQRVHNGPPLAGHGAQAVRDAIAESITTLPQQLRRSLAWDQGTEMAQHAQLRIDTNLDIYFCDPQSPWQRGTNENTNDLLRQYFPKGTDLSRHSRGDLDAVAAALNSRPRKTLNWKTPAETLDEHLHSLKQDTVATTP